MKSSPIGDCLNAASPGRLLKNTTSSTTKLSSPLMSRPSRRYRVGYCPGSGLRGAFWHSGHPVAAFSAGMFRIRTDVGTAHREFLLVRIVLGYCQNAGNAGVSFNNLLDSSNNQSGSAGLQSKPDSIYRLSCKAWPPLFLITIFDHGLQSFVTAAAGSPWQLQCTLSLSTTGLSVSFS